MKCLQKHARTAAASPRAVPKVPAPRTRVLAAFQPASKSPNPNYDFFSHPTAFPLTKSEQGPNWQPETDTAPKAHDLAMDDVRAMFKFADVDGNGQIDRSELERLLALGIVKTNHTSAQMKALKHSQHWYTPEEVSRVMKLYDHDNNGILDFNEFTELVYDGLFIEATLDDYAKAFKAVDTNGDGTINFQELQELFREVNSHRTAADALQIPEETLVQVWQRYGKDQVDFNEFLELFRSHLLDLKAVLEYAGAAETKGAALMSHDAVRTLEGTSTLINSEAELDDVLARAPATKPVVLLAAMTWSREDETVMQSFRMLAQSMKTQATFIHMFGNMSPESKHLFKRLRARATPALFIFKDQKCVESFVGTNAAQMYAAVTRRALL